ncbi:MAG: hypothetical protein LBS14_02560 [Holosporaceae bacterium]|jgi:hypothetical protein|nr:hypothetical protein [Holosporaceae bacterium]
MEVAMFLQSLRVLCASVCCLSLAVEAESGGEHSGDYTKEILTRTERLDETGSGKYECSYTSSRNGEVIEQNNEQGTIVVDRGTGKIRYIKNTAENNTESGEQQNTSRERRPGVPGADVYPNEAASQESRLTEGDRNHQNFRTPVHAGISRTDTLSAHIKHKLRKINYHFNSLASGGNPETKLGNYHAIKHELSELKSLAKKLAKGHQHHQDTRHDSQQNTETEPQHENLPEILDRSNSPSAYSDTGLNSSERGRRPSGPFPSMGEFLFGL